jgi:hypothetical protein
MSPWEQPPPPVLEEVLLLAVVNCEDVNGTSCHALGAVRTTRDGLGVYRFGIGTRTDLDTHGLKILKSANKIKRIQDIFICLHVHFATLVNVVAKGTSFASSRKPYHKTLRYFPFL